MVFNLIFIQIMVLIFLLYLNLGFSPLLPPNACFSRGLLYGVLLGFTGCACLYSFLYRSKLRGQYDLEEEPCNDCLVHFCCCPLALCQEYRELKNRGFDMEIGWEANMDRQKRGVAMMPIVIPGMTR
ncbi:hypothetical protein V6Z11_D13G043200 [Gossypium hirsutum]|uniref:Uncharacterized protein n=1 Tax=Gossypium tomentosum TaxID=34277 RepID=A0A5D2HSW4_GOSTO|nr:hypothetical protein ES332_D13G043500v1 [Gossypium tomentosum]